MLTEIRNREIARSKVYTDAMLKERYQKTRKEILEIHKGFDLPGRIIFHLAVNNEGKRTIWYTQPNKEVQRKSIWNIRYFETRYFSFENKMAPLAVLPCNNVDEILAYTEYFSNLFCDDKIEVIEPTEGDCKIMTASLEFPCRVLHALVQSKGNLYFSIQGFTKKESKKLLKSIKLSELSKPFEREGEALVIPLLVDDYVNLAGLRVQTNELVGSWYTKLLPNT